MRGQRGEAVLTVRVQGQSVFVAVVYVYNSGPDDLSLNLLTINLIKSMRITIRGPVAYIGKHVALLKVICWSFL